jgi:hypothetical protein
MNNSILKTKHWQVFLLFALLYAAIQYFQASPLLGGCLFLLALVVFVGWYALLANALHHYLPRGVTYSLSWFLLDAFLVIASYGAALIFFDGNLQVNGVAAIPAFYLFFAIGHLFWLPAVALVACETKKQPEFGQYAGTLLQMFFWPIGIWFVQPRLNRLYVSVQAGTFTYSS